MLEVIALTLLVGLIGDMARRRGRNSKLFVTGLLACWLCGEFAGAAFGYCLWNKPQLSEVDFLVIYGFAIVGAWVGVAVAFLVVRQLGPVDGQWRELPEKSPLARSRVKGAIVGGLGGAIIGSALGALGAAADGTSTDAAEKFYRIALGCLAVGFVGALLGLVSGLQKKEQGHS